MNPKQSSGLNTKKSKPYIKEFINAPEADKWMEMKNETSNNTVYAVVEGLENNWLVVDLVTAIKIGNGYHWCGC